MGDGEHILKHAGKLGFEGVVSKMIDARYALGKRLPMPQSPKSGLPNSSLVGLGYRSLRKSDARSPRALHGNEARHEGLGERVECPSALK